MPTDDGSSHHDGQQPDCAGRGPLHANGKRPPQQPKGQGGGSADRCGGSSSADDNERIGLEGPVIGETLPPEQLQRLRKRVKVVHPLPSSSDGCKATSVSDHLEPGPNFQPSSSDNTESDPAQQSRPPLPERVTTALDAGSPHHQQLQRQQDLHQQQSQQPVLGHVQNQLQLLYSWYNNNRNNYLDQAKGYLTLLDVQQRQQQQQQGQHPSSSQQPGPRAEEVSAVARAVETAMQIMQASANVESQMNLMQAASAGAAAPPTALDLAIQQQQQQLQQGLDPSFQARQ